MADISITRHQSIFNVAEHRDRVCIIGAGATGSRIFMALVELGITNITVADFDTVEAHNLANQAFGHKHIGGTKIAGLKALYEEKTGYAPPKSMLFHEKRVPDPEVVLEGTVFLLTDTMASRKEIYERCIKGNPNVTDVIETRMASSHGNVFNFNPHSDGDKWLATLIDDGEAELSPCGTPISVGTTASVIANLAIWQHILNKTDPGIASGLLNVFLKPTMLIEGKL
jgi:hypothetical protein